VTPKEKFIDTLTNELKVLRAKAGITQQELADRLGVSRRTYGIIDSLELMLNGAGYERIR